MIISNRCKQIIQHLLETNQPLSVSDLGELLHVTKRTIYRQMPEVTKTIEAFDLTLEQTFGKGMSLVGSFHNMKRMATALAGVSTTYSYTSHERVNLMILKLLNESTYIKTQTLAIDMNTSMQTIRNDYIPLKEKVSVHGISFETKKSEGVQLIGGEIPTRHLFANIVIDCISTGDFFDWISEEASASNAFAVYLESIEYKETLVVLYRRISKIMQRKNMNISDKELQEFLLLICIFVKRHIIATTNQDSMATKMHIPNGDPSFYEELLHLLETEFQIQVADSEADYFHWMINLYAGRNQYKTFNETTTLRSFDQINELICEVTKEFHFPFDTDQNLCENLMLHTVMALERVESGIITANPMLDQVYRSNPTLYKIVKKCFEKVFHGIHIPEDEIGYIVIYFLASMDYLSRQSLSVLVVCSTGIGSSKMLRSRLEREFGEIRVKKTISLHKVEEEDMSEYDFIVSTDPLDMNHEKYVCVSPLLIQEDKDYIRTYIDRIHRTIR